MGKKQCFYSIPLLSLIQQINLFNSKLVCGAVDLTVTKGKLTVTATQSSGNSKLKGCKYQAASKGSEGNTGRRIQGLLAQSLAFSCRHFIFLNACLLICKSLTCVQTLIIAAPENLPHQRLYAVWLHFGPVSSVLAADCSAFPKNSNSLAEVMGILVLSIALSQCHFPLIQNLCYSKHICSARQSVRKPGFSPKLCGVWNKPVLLRRSIFLAYIIERVD